MANVADSPNFWWRERADFETKVLVPNATSWSVVGRDLVSNGIIEGRIGGTKYFLRVPASASELTGDARCSSPESHKKLAEKVVSVWPRQHGQGALSEQQDCCSTLSRWSLLPSNQSLKASIQLVWAAHRLRVAARAEGEAGQVP